MHHVRKHTKLSPFAFLSPCTQGGSLGTRQHTYMYCTLKYWHHAHTDLLGIHIRLLSNLHDAHPICGVLPHNGVRVGNRGVGFWYEWHHHPRPTTVANQLCTNALYMDDSDMYVHIQEWFRHVRTHTCTRVGISLLHCDTEITYM